MKRISVPYLVASLFLILALTLGGCAIPPLPGTSPPTTPTTPTTPPAVNPINPGYTLPPPSVNSIELPSIAEVVAKVKPSVVAINTEITGYDIFNQPLTQQGAGSGWILDKSGIIVTNNHVVQDAESITVTLDDGRTFTVDTSKVATDALADLAVLKIDATNLPALTLGDSTVLRVGDWVVAIGNALGEGISATDGIVSRKGATITVDTGQTLRDLIQTNAAINPGNSGGPLVNLAGEVVGITSAKLSAVGVEGMGYAISIHEASPIIQGLIQKGYIVRPWLGVVLSTVNQWLVLTEDLAVDKGVFITFVAPDSPAEKAGLKEGDVITSFDGKEVNTADDLLQILHTSQIGQKVEIIYWQGKIKSSTSATLAESPPPS